MAVEPRPYKVPRTNFRSGILSSSTDVYTRLKQCSRQVLHRINIAMIKYTYSSSGGHPLTGKAPCVCHGFIQDRKSENETLIGQKANINVGPWDRTQHSVHSLRWSPPICFIGCRKLIEGGIWCIAKFCLDFAIPAGISFQRSSMALDILMVLEVTAFVLRGSTTNAS